jgi:hypothetical protein
MRNVPIFGYAPGNQSISLECIDLDRNLSLSQHGRVESTEMQRRRFFCEPRPGRGCYAMVRTLSNVARRFLAFSAGSLDLGFRVAALTGAARAPDERHVPSNDLRHVAPPPNRQTQGRLRSQDEGTPLVNDRALEDPMGSVGPQGAGTSAGRAEPASHTPHRIGSCHGT